jgi:hypothetical protein
MKEERAREAVKRSVHFVLPNDFAKALEKAVPGLCREFWAYLDTRSAARAKLRNLAWNVWNVVGADTLSVAFTHNTKIVVNKENKTTMMLQLKETGGKLTDLMKVLSPSPVGNPHDPVNVTQFEKIWRLLVSRGEGYPSLERPVTAAVANVVAGRYKAPLAVVLFCFNTRFQPSLLSNGLIELARQTMPGEVFTEDVVQAAQDAGETERVDHWTFKVKKAAYQRWRMRVTSTPIVLQTQIT